MHNFDTTRFTRVGKLALAHPNFPCENLDYILNISIPTPINRVGAPTILFVGSDVKGLAPLNPASGTGERFVK